MARKIVRADEVEIGDKFIETENTLYVGTVTDARVSSATGRVTITLASPRKGKPGKFEYHVGQYAAHSTHDIERNF